jgi:hypothetical protein
MIVLLAAGLFAAISAHAALDVGASPGADSSTTTAAVVADPGVSAVSGDSTTGFAPMPNVVQVPAPEPGTFPAGIFILVVTAGVATRQIVQRQRSA